MKPLLLILMLTLSLPVFGSGNHHEKPQNVPDGGSNHNALAIAVVIGAGICIYHRCWKEKPEPFTNPERVIIRQKP